MGIQEVRRQEKNFFGFKYGILVFFSAQVYIPKHIPGKNPKHRLTPHHLGFSEYPAQRFNRCDKSQEKSKYPSHATEAKTKNKIK